MTNTKGAVFLLQLYQIVSIGGNKNSTLEKTKQINVTYVYVRQPPYEDIINDEWKFAFGKNNKNLQGLISKSINYIKGKHCDHFNFIPRRVPNHLVLAESLKKTHKELHDDGIDGDHYVFGPLPMSTFLYYHMHYNPKTFHWVSGFAETPGLIVVNRLDDVCISLRLLGAINDAKLMIMFLLMLTPIVGAIMWVADHSLKAESDINITR